MANFMDVKKVAEIEQNSDYLFSPLKRNFRSGVRITAYVILAYKKFKRALCIAKNKRGEQLSEGSNLEDINYLPVKFVSFPIISTGLDQSPKHWNRSSLQNVFQTRDVVVSVNNVNIGTDTFKCLKNHYIPRLTEEQLSASLEYLFKRTTAEVLKYLDKKSIEKKGVMIDGVLYSKTRLKKNNH